MTAQYERTSTRGTTDDRSFGQVIGDVMANAQEIIRGEIRLAKAETRQEATQAARSSALLAAGVVFALFAFLMVLFTAVWALDEALPLWLSSAIVAAVVGLIAAVLLVIGRSRLEQVDLKPTQTIESVKETAEWLKHPKQSA